MKLSTSSIFMSLCVTTACMGCLICLCIPFFLINGITSLTIQGIISSIRSNIRIDLPSTIMYNGFFFDNYLFQNSLVELSVGGKAVPFKLYPIDNGNKISKDIEYVFRSDQKEDYSPFGTRGLNFFAVAGDTFTVTCEKCLNGTWIFSPQFLRTIIDDDNDQLQKVDSNPIVHGMLENKRHNHWDSHRHKNHDGPHHEKHPRRKSNDHFISRSGTLATYTIPFSGGWNLNYVSSAAIETEKTMHFKGNVTDYEVVIDKYFTCSSDGCDIPVTETTKGVFVKSLPPSSELKISHPQIKSFGSLLFTPSILLIVILSLCCCGCLGCGICCSLRPSDKGYARLNDGTSYGGSHFSEPAPASGNNHSYQQTQYLPYPPNNAQTSFSTYTLNPATYQA